MVQFASWKDSYLFLKEFGSFTCLQCSGCNHNLDTSVEHTDGEYARFFCIETISMVRLDYMFTCSYWKGKDGKTIDESDMDKCIFNLSADVLEKLDVEDKKWTIEEIRQLVEDNDNE